MRFLKDDYTFSSALFFSVQSRASPQADMLIDGKKAHLGEAYPKGVRVSVDLGGVLLSLQLRAAEFGDSTPASTIDSEEEMLTVSLDLLDGNSPHLLKWSDIPVAFAAVTVQMADHRQSLEEFDREYARQLCLIRMEKQRVELDWTVSGSQPHLAGGTRIRQRRRAKQSRSFLTRRTCRAGSAALR